MKRILAWSKLLLVAVCGCGSVAEAPRVTLGERRPDDAASTSTALLVATRDGVSTIVRIDAESATMAPLTPPLPTIFRPRSFDASLARDRFVVSGEANGRAVVYAGTRDEWHVLAELEEGWWVSHVSPSLDLVALSGHGVVGRPIGGRIVRFDGTVAKDLGASLDPVHVDDGGFVAVEYELERVDDDGFVRVTREKQPWWAFDAAGRRVRLTEDRHPHVQAFAVENGFAIRNDGRCSTFRWSDPAAPAATFPCDEVAPPFIFAGGSAYRGRADGRELVAALPDSKDGVIAALDPDGVSVLVSLRQPENTQVVTFTTADGASVTYDPGDAAGRDLGAAWTRAATRGGLACAVASRNGCNEGWTGTCLEDIVDIVCSDARTQRSRRLQRSLDANGRVARGGQQFIITDDARYVLWVEGGVIHRLDARTFETTVLESSSSFGPREGDLPNVFNRPMP